MPKLRNCTKQSDRSESTYLAATPSIFLFNIHCDKSKQVKSSQNVLEVKVKVI